MKKIKRGVKLGHTWSRADLASRSKPCTVDGKKIYPSVSALIGALGQGRNGYGSKEFKYMHNGHMAGKNDKST